MNQKSLNVITGTIFLVIGILHLLRIINTWPVSISTFTVPMWASWVAVLVSGCLAYHGLKKK